MKCKVCGKRVVARLGETEIAAGGKTVRVINIPAFYCENCEKEYFHKIVLQKAEIYVYRKNLPDVLDYAAFEEAESEDMLANGLFHNP